MMTKRSIGILSAAVAAVGLSVASAQAATFASLIQTGPLPTGTVNKIHDVDLEYLKTDGNGNGLLDVGDVIAGYINFGQILVPNQVGLGQTSGNVNDELTGYFQVRVSSKVATLDPNNPFKFTFGPDASFLGNGATGGAMAELFTQGNSLGNGAPDANLSTTVNNATAFAETTNGALVWILGFSDPTQASHDVLGSTVSGNGEGWVATGSDVFNLQGINPGTQLATVNFTVNALATGTTVSGIVLLNQTLDGATRNLIGASVGAKAQFVGSSTLSGTRNTTGDFAADSTTDVTFVAAAPLPPALWSGLTLLGSMGVSSLIRRRNRTAV